MRKAAAALFATGLVGTAQDFTPTDLGAGRQTKPRGKMFGRLPAAHIGTDLGKNLEGRVGVDAVYAGQVNPRHVLERCPHVGGRGVIRDILGIEAPQLF
jgi:hypothetical protein